MKLPEGRLPWHRHRVASNRKRRKSPNEVAPVQSLRDRVVLKVKTDSLSKCGVQESLAALCEPPVPPFSADPYQHRLYSSYSKHGSLR